MNDWKQLLLGGSGWTKFFKAISWVLVGALVGLICFRVLFVNFVDNYEKAYKFDARTGETTLLERTGYIVTPPFLVKVHHVDLRPMQVCISAIQRVLNCKLVQFDPKGLLLFVSWHGRDDYDGPGTIASSGHNASTNDTLLQNILKNYAYEGSGKDYPFLTILRELKSEEASQ